MDRANHLSASPVIAGQDPVPEIADGDPDPEIVAETENGAEAETENGAGAETEKGAEAMREGRDPGPVNEGGLPDLRGGSLQFEKDLQSSQ